jgi:hypothetical protein
MIDHYHGSIWLVFPSISFNFNLAGWSACALQEPEAWKASLDGDATYQTDTACRAAKNALAPYLLLHSSLPAQGFWQRTLLDSMPRRNQDSAGCCKSEHFSSDYEELKPGQLNKIDNKIAKVYQSNIVYYIFILYCIILYIYIKVDQTTTMDSLSEQQVHQHQHIHPRMNPQRRRQPLKLSCSCQSLYLRGRQPYSTEWSSSASAQNRYSQ